MKDYQQKRMKEYLLPEAVYRQALWAVKDLNRLNKRREELEQNLDSVPAAKYDRVNDSSTGKVNITERMATEMANISMRIDAIEDALLEIPEKYRTGIKNKLVYSVDFQEDYHANTWKKWQQVFIFHVARNLNLY